MLAGVILGKCLHCSPGRRRCHCRGSCRSCYCSFVHHRSRRVTASGSTLAGGKEKAALAEEQRRAPRSRGLRGRRGLRGPWTQELALQLSSPHPPRPLPSLSGSADVRPPAQRLELDSPCRSCPKLCGEKLPSTLHSHRCRQRREPAKLGSVWAGGQHS